MIEELSWLSVLSCKQMLFAVCREEQKAMEQRLNDLQSKVIVGGVNLVSDVFMEKVHARGICSSLVAQNAPIATIMYSLTVKIHKKIYVQAFLYKCLI